MVAVGISLIVKDSRIVVSIYKLTCEDEEKINPEVWHTGRKAGRLDMNPISIEIKRPEDPIRVKQYPIPLEGRRGLKPIMDDLINKGILEPCMSRHNTPILAIRKTDGSYRLVQDLRAINERTKTRFPVVANPYTLLNRVSPEDIWYSVIDLKDAFWTCPLAEGSSDFFAFQWEDPETNRKQQLRWASLPQGFVDSPNLFGQALEQLLSQFSPRKGTKILQYVDDLLVAGETEEEVRKCTIELLNFLGEKGLKVSKQKLQFTEPEVKYLGHWIVKGKKRGIKQDYSLELGETADQEARRAALLTLGIPENPRSDPQEFPPCPTGREVEEFKKIGGTLEEGKWKLPDGRELIPKAYARKILKRLHSQTHWGTQALAEQFLKFFGCKGIFELAKQEVQGCMICQKINKSRIRQVTPGRRPLAYRPFGRIQVDFTELPKIGRHKYLLVIVDQLIHWVEAFPSPRATAQTVARRLLEEIIPRYGIPDSIDSDQGTHFTSKITKHLADALGIRWEYHTPWHPQSSGQVERMNQTLKAQISKLMLETKMSWMKCLPLALLNIRTQPHSGSGLSPFKMLYGMPYEHGMPVGHPRVEDCQIQSYLVLINKNLQELRKRGLIAQSTPLGFAIHKIQPGDKVLIKTWRETPLSPHWEGLFLILLTTDTAVRTAERGWTHSSRVKRIEPQDSSPQWKITLTPGDLKLRIHRKTQSPALTG
ncbi:hypothetical protein DUI87_00994 [Hirundo rustica rustica]|uniref:Gypsy retrotransposon integrase-like protein 1 n=1 Tax=Hirundo rustica rustica TaxID=333673 RepID=A0A3M0L450_HIRRU|nr:hypothetical protein DUI87_00994 [Hirundo rustica rustica]